MRDLSSQQPVPSTRWCYLPTPQTKELHCHVSTGLERTRQALWFKHAWQQARGEDCWAIAKRPGGKLQTSFLPPRCTTLAPHGKAARKTRSVGAELHHQGLLWQKGENLHKRGTRLLCMQVLRPVVSLHVVLKEQVPDSAPGMGQPQMYVHTGD